MGSVGCTCYCQPNQGQQKKAQSPNAPTEYVPDEGAAFQLEQSQGVCWKTQARPVPDSPHDSSRPIAETKGGSCSSTLCPHACPAEDEIAPVPGTASVTASEAKLNMHVRQNSRETNQNLIGTLKTVSRLAPMKVVKFDALKAHKRLPRSNEGLAVLYETLDPKTRVIFLSHRWLRPWQSKEECEKHGCVWAGEPHPDDEQYTKWTLLIDAIEKIVERKRNVEQKRGCAPAEEWSLQRVAIWLDFACIDQDDATLRTAGVGSLLGYMARCELVVVPTLQKPDHCTVHRMKSRKKKDEDQNSDTDNYGVRAWTRLEAMCFYVLSLLRGQENPELYYAAPHSDVGKMDYVLLPYTLPSNGTLTVKNDSTVILGHERTLLNVLHESAIGGCKASQGPAWVAAAAATELKTCDFSADQKSYLQDLLEHGLDPNTQDNQGLTAIWSASWVGRFDQVQMLLESKADPNMSASSGLAALHNAARKGHLESAQVLLDHRADIELQDKQGNTPLMWAIQHNKIEAATFILDSGAKTKLMKSLQLAQKLQYEPFVTMIMDRFTQAEVDRTDSMIMASSVESGSLSMAVVRARRVSKLQSTDSDPIQGSVSSMDVGTCPTTPSTIAPLNSSLTQTPTVKHNVTQSTTNVTQSTTPLLSATTTAPSLSESLGNPQPDVAQNATSSASAAPTTPSSAAAAVPKKPNASKPSAAHRFGSHMPSIFRGSPR